MTNIPGLGLIQDREDPTNDPIVRMLNKSLTGDNFKTPAGYYWERVNFDPNCRPIDKYVLKRY